MIEAVKNFLDTLMNELAIPIMEGIETSSANIYIENAVEIVKSFINTLLDLFHDNVNNINIFGDIDLLAVLIVIGCIIAMVSIVVVILKLAFNTTTLLTKTEWREQWKRKRKK